MLLVLLQSTAGMPRMWRCRWVLVLSLCPSAMLIGLCSSYTPRSQLVTWRVAAGAVQLRRLPQLAADTPLYMLLQLFEVGGSHMALLTKPRQGSISSLPKVKSGVIWAGAVETELTFCCG